MSLDHACLRPDGTIRALTLWPEWVWAIHHLDKRVENRGWAIPKGEWFALHAGKSIGGTGRIYRGNLRCNEAMAEAAHGVAEMAERAGWASDGTIRRSTFIRGAQSTEWDIGTITVSAIVGLFRVHDHITGDHGGWHAPSQIGSVFDYVPLVEPVACKGAQGLWTVPADVVERMAVAP